MGKITKKMFLLLNLQFKTQGTFYFIEHNLIGEQINLVYFQNMFLAVVHFSSNSWFPYFETG